MRLIYGGGIRANAAAEDLRARATLLNYRTAALTLASDISLTWVRLIDAQNQINILNTQLETNGKVLKVLRGRFGVGQVRSADILRQRLLMESVREEKILAETRLRTLEHQLAVLKGMPPQSAKFKPPQALPDLPAQPETGLPAELVQRRPDIQSIYYSIKAADKDVAVALSNRYPRLTLSASYISDAASPENLFSSWMTTFAAALIGPVFDGGERRSEVNRTQARRAELINTYKQTTLDAFQEVENALIREQKQAERIQNLRLRLDLAEKTYQQLQTGYFNGASDYIDTLTALSEKQQIERDLLDARRLLVEYRINLYRALAGGFETPRESISENAMPPLQEPARDT